MRKSRIVIVGGGFAGYYAARSLCRKLGDEAAEIVIVNPTDYFLYLPLLPEVAAGVLDPRRVRASIPGTVPQAELVLSSASGVDLTEHRDGWWSLDDPAEYDFMAFRWPVLTGGDVRGPPDAAVNEGTGAA
jgi:NADH dehydrogenase FAD-containing subunit